MLQDLRHAIRGLAKTPGFTAVAVLTLALGIGANAAVLAVAYGALIRPLPYSDASRLVVLNRFSSDGNDLGFSPSEVDRCVSRFATLETAAAYTDRPLTLQVGGQSVNERLDALERSLIQ